LRWRTEAEVLAYSGERTCGNLRCDHFEALEEDDELLARWRRKHARRRDDDDSRSRKQSREEEEDESPLVPQELTPYQCKFASSIVVSLRLIIEIVNFAYEEEGQPKAALVKVVLCSRCAKKLRKGREAARMQQTTPSGSS